MGLYEEQRQWIDNLYTARTSDSEIAFYNQNAAQYDRLNASARYKAPAEFGEVVEEFEKLHEVEIPRNGKILDVGAGTGQAGEVLRDTLKFTGPMDALEPSDEMWAIAKNKGIYSKYYSFPLLENEVSALPSDEYDFVFSVGCFNNRSMKARCLKELIRTAKKGTFIAAVMNRRYFDEAFGAYVHELSDAGEIEIKVEKMLDQYINDFVGAAVVVKKL